MIQIYALVYGMYSAICITTYVLLLKLYNVSLRLNSATVPLKQLTHLLKSYLQRLGATKQLYYILTFSSANGRFALNCRMVTLTDYYKF